MEVTIVKHGLAVNAAADLVRSLDTDKTWAFSCTRNDINGYIVATIDVATITRDELQAYARRGVIIEGQRVAREAVKPTSKKAKTARVVSELKSELGLVSDALASLNDETLYNTFQRALLESANKGTDMMDRLQALAIVEDTARDNAKA